MHNRELPLEVFLHSIRWGFDERLRVSGPRGNIFNRNRRETGSNTRWSSRFGRHAYLLSLMRSCRRLQDIILGSLRVRVRRNVMVQSLDHLRTRGAKLPGVTRYPGIEHSRSSSMSPLCRFGELLVFSSPSLLTQIPRSQSRFLSFR
jgi:hypothetical protein